MAESANPRDISSSSFGRLGMAYGDGKHAYKISGASQYEDAIERIVGGRTKEGADYECMALLTPEPSNLHDPCAISVSIEGAVVGHIQKDHADLVRRAIAQAGCSATGCRARIVGGWEREDGNKGYFGVQLDLSFPVVVEIWSNKRRGEEAITTRSDSSRLDSNRIDNNRTPPRKSGARAKKVVLTLLGLGGVVAVGALFMQPREETNIRQPSSLAVRPPATVTVEVSAATGGRVPLPRPRPPMRLTP